MFFLQKKGISADIFTWILASIAGVFILVFFYRFATQHISVSETLTERQLVEHFIDELDAFGTSESSTKTLSFRDNVQLRFQCGSIGVGSYTKDLYRSVFAPPEVDGSTLSLWTEVWNFPFPITNFFYVTTKKTRTILVYDDKSVQFIQRFIAPKGMNIQSVHIKQLNLQELHKQTQGLENLHLIYFAPVRDVDTIVSTFRGVIPSVVEVNLDEHTVRSLASGDEHVYFGDAMLYGVFFATEQFGCLKR